MKIKIFNSPVYTSGSEIELKVNKWLEENDVYILNIFQTQSSSSSSFGNMSVITITIVYEENNKEKNDDDYIATLLKNREFDKLQKLLNKAREHVFEEEKPIKLKKSYKLPHLKDEDIPPMPPVKPIPPTGHKIRTDWRDYGD